MTSGIRLWDDNPTEVDLLGFGPFVDTIVAALESPGLDPVTIGVHAPWGGGKSSILRLLEHRLAQQSGYLVIRLDPWEIDDQFDVRGSVIAEVLQHLLTEYASQPDLTKRVDDLLQRVGHSRVAVALTRGSLLMQSGELLTALTPTSKKDVKGLAGFRTAFHALLQSLSPLQRIVVLVDDLDRCLPDAVMATLEAIKLFLAVEKVAFVLAADQVMVRESIAASLHATGRGEQFALRYVEKIVQVPLSLPRIGGHETETFIALLLSAQACEEPDHYSQLVQHAQIRRAQGKAPVLSALQDLPWKPEGVTLNLAKRLATGMSARSSGSPRSIKRFLNAFTLRTRIAEGQGIDIDPSVIAKLMLLEDSHDKDFELLVELPDAQRPDLLVHWQEWGRGERDDKPPTVSEDSKLWAGSEPDLAQAPIGRYLTLAASLGSLTAGASLSQEQLTWVLHMAGESEVHRDTAQQEVLTRPVAEQRAVAAALLDRGRGVDNADPLVQSLVVMATATQELSAEIAQGLWDLRTMLTPTSIYEVATSDIAELRTIAERVANSDDVDQMVRETARTAVAG